MSTPKHGINFVVSKFHINLDPSTIQNHYNLAASFGIIWFLITYIVSSNQETKLLDKLVILIPTIILMVSLLSLSISKVPEKIFIVKMNIPPPRDYTLPEDEITSEDYERILDARSWIERPEIRKKLMELRTRRPLN